MGIMLGNLSVKDIETRLGITLSAEDVAVLPTSSGNIPGRCAASFRLDLNGKERRTGSFRL